MANNYESAFIGLRKAVLNLRRSEVHAKTTGHPVYAAVVDMCLGAVTVSLTCVADGKTNLYYSNGGAMHALEQRSKEIYHATLEFLYSAEQVLDVLRPAKVFDLPSEGEHNIYLVTDEGIYKETLAIRNIAAYQREQQFLNFLYENVLTKINIYATITESDG